MPKDNKLIIKVSHSEVFDQFESHYVEDDASRFYRSLSEEIYLIDDYDGHETAYLLYVFLL